MSQATQIQKALGDVERALAVIYCAEDRSLKHHVDLAYKLQLAAENYRSVMRRAYEGLI